MFLKDSAFMPLGSQATQKNKINGVLASFFQSSSISRGSGGCVTQESPESVSMLINNEVKAGPYGKWSSRGRQNVSDEDAPRDGPRR